MISWQPRFRLWWFLIQNEWKILFGLPCLLWRFVIQSLFKVVSYSMLIQSRCEILQNTLLAALTPRVAVSCTILIQN